MLMYIRRVEFKRLPTFPANFNNLGGSRFLAVNCDQCGMKLVKKERFMQT